MTLRYLSTALLAGLVAGCQQQAGETPTDARGRSGDAVRSNDTAGRMVTPAAGAERPARDLIGRQMDVQVDVGRHGNDIAFWSGTAPDDLLAVIDRDLRTEGERAAGRPAERAMALPLAGTVMLRGTVEPVPHAEAMYGWGLTRADTRRLAEKGVYLRLHQIVR
jgi:hypothetical protein